MRTLVCQYRGFDIYVWTTGKYEAYLGDKPAGMASRQLEDVMEKIDIYREG